MENNKDNNNKEDNCNCHKFWLHGYSVYFQIESSLNGEKYLALKVDKEETRCSSYDLNIKVNISITSPNSNSIQPIQISEFNGQIDNVNKNCNILLCENIFSLNQLNFSANVFLCK